MEIEKIIEFLKKETPEHEDLLNAAYESVCNLLKAEQKNIDNRISVFLSERDYVKVNEYVQMSKKVSILGYPEPPVQCLRATLPEKESHFH